MTNVENVIILSDLAFVNGGQPKVAIDTALFLAKAGKKVTFFAPTGPVDPKLAASDVRVVCLNQLDILNEPNPLRAMARGIWNRSAAHALRQLLTEFDPATTIIHAHGFAKAMSPAIGPILTDGPIAAIYTMHEYNLACPNGGFYDFQKQEICTRKALGVSCLTTNCDARRPVHKAYRIVRQFSVMGPGRMPRGLKEVIYISDTQKRVMDPYMSPQTRLHHVPNPIPGADLPWVKASDNDAFVFIGRLNPEKGGLMFAEAARLAGVRAVVVGDGDEAAQMRALNPQIEILGWQTPDQVQDWLGKARALVFPSIWYETFGLSAYEALRRGVPVVCGAWNAAAEAVHDGVTGVLYDQPTAEKLAQALTDASKIADFTPADTGPIASPDQYTAQLLGIYQSCVAAHLNRRAA